MTPIVRRRRGAAAALMMVVCAVSAHGQTQGDDSTASAVFFPRAAFHMAAEHLSGDDPRYVWDADFGGALDIVDYGLGRFTFEANYEVVLGEEIRSFDPNQGNYILAGLASVRAGRTEIAGVLYHQSRHLADRPKEDAVAWNMLGGRVRRAFSYEQAVIEARADLRGTIMKAFVDYSWELDAGVRTDVKIAPAVGVLVSGSLRYLGVDDSRGRGNQTGYRVEGGVRFDGRAGAIELFVAGERRVDPFPLEFGAVQWVTTGFRLLSRQ